MGCFSIFSFVVVCTLCLFTLEGNAEPVDDKNALLDFVSKLPHLHDLNWRENTSVCGNWVGVTCSSDKSRVTAVRLPAVGFHGQIPANTLSRLSALQILSLRSNRISGPFPSDFSNLRNLSMLYLQYKQIFWSTAGFTGRIPPSLSKLTQLSSLVLARNLLSGGIPDLGLVNLQQLDLSHNNLTGSVPKSLQRFPSSSFVGNHVLLGKSSHDLPVLIPSSQLSKKPKNGRRLRNTLLQAIIIGCGVLGLVAFAFLFVICCLKGKKEEGFTGKFPKGNMSPEKTISGGQDAKNRMVFFEGCSYAFDLEDLLRASAEVLGKGTFGMSYKAILEDANIVVVKRLKDVSAGKREFEQQMEVIGSIRHENVVALRAYYYSKDEKLMVSDYCSQGSISTLLHGGRDEHRILFGLGN
ncbi:hypothetical protein Ancab_032777 [Ancistrocladus abbreviatus]